MTNDEIDEFVSRYITEMQNTTSDETSEWGALENLTDSEPGTAWRVITRLVAKSPDMYVHQIGAGPLESLLSNRPELIGMAIELATTNTKFREALRFVRGVEISTEYQEAYNQLWRSDHDL